MDVEWDDDNTKHIWRHRVRPHEAEEAIDDLRAVPVDATDLEEERDAVLGMTAHGRLLVVVFTVRSEWLRVVTARPPSGREERLCWTRL